MALLQFEGIYKNKIIKLLINNELVIKMINPTPNPKLDDIADVLLGFSGKVGSETVEEQGHIFDHDFVDDTVTNEKTFIFIETQIPTISTSSPLVDFNLYITVFCHERLVDLNNNSVPTKNEMKKMGYIGNRIDILCSVIDKIMMGNKNLGIGAVSPSKQNFSCVYKPKIGYYGKQLRYIVKGYNSGSEMCDSLE